MSLMSSHRRPSLRRTASALGALAVALMAGPVAAQELPKAKVTAVYDIAYSGLNVATADYALTLADGRYQAGISYKTTGFLGMIGDVRGTAAGQGRVNGTGVQPGLYTLNGKDPRRTRKVRIEHSSGGLAFQSEPAPKVGGGRVPLTPDVIKGSLDPIGALVIAAKPGTQGTAVCNRSVPVFDGWSRYDVMFAPKGERPITLQGYTGAAVVCAARLKNVAGHKPQDKTSLYWEANRDLEARLIPIGTSGLYVPAGLSIKTQYGQLEITLRRIAIETSKAADASPIR
jgi:hypothetical protein